MFTTDDIKKTTAKFDEVLSKRSRPRDLSDSPVAYQSLAVVRKLNKAKFPVYLTASKVNKQNYAMKIFANYGDKDKEYFRNEARFAKLKHPNVIDIVNYEEDREAIQTGELKKVSYILMEFAPHGDFFDFLTNHRAEMDEKLTRTYFRQLIDGLEYLHENGVAHLDLKPENLLLGADFNLKIADFDLSHVDGDARIMSRGTRYYRGPEFYKSSSSKVELECPYASDIYGAGIILFIFMSGGMYPHAESKAVRGINFSELMYTDNNQFWAKHCEIQGRKSSFYSKEFKELFNGMVKENPAERLTIKQIKQSKWYNGPIYFTMEFHQKMKKALNC